jgi:hypothetical protein
MTTPRKVKRRKIRLSRLEESTLAGNRKLADPKDKDDPRWVKAGLRTMDALIEKKERSLEHKQTQRKARKNQRRKNINPTH